MTTSIQMKPPQAMQPHGLTGRLFGTLMERVNKPAYERAAILLDLPPAGRFLEIGFGTGRLIEMLARRMPHGQVAGIDASKLMVETAHRRLKNMDADIRQGTAEALPWDNASFDRVAALHCFQFWPDPVQVLSEVRRVLRPDGKFVLILRNHARNRNADWLPNPWSRAPDEPLEALMLLDRAGFAATWRLPDVGTSAVILAQQNPA
jgi:SAM-dependent methyltransferase